MSQLELRAADADDLPLIVRGERDYMTEVEPEHLGRWESVLEQNVALWTGNLRRTAMAVLDGADAGYAMWRRDGAAATLVTIYVLPRYRRHGIAGTLVQAVVSAARADGATALDLGVHQRNAARALYERAGFTLVRVDGEYRYYTLPLAAA